MENSGNVELIKQGASNMQANIIVINGKNVERIDYKGQPVITFRMIDELHQRVSGTAKRNFNTNQSYLIENEDYFRVPYKEWKKILCVRKTYAQRKDFITFLTLQGYLILVKSFKDERAWKVQRQLVTAYFIVNQFEKFSSNDNDLTLDEQLNKLSKLSRIKKDLSHAEFNHLKAQILGNIYDEQSILNNIKYAGTKSSLIKYLDLLLEAYKNGKTFEGISIKEDSDQIIIAFRTQNLLKAFNAIAEHYGCFQQFKTAQALNAYIRNTDDLIRFNWTYNGKIKTVNGYYVNNLIKSQ